MHPGIYQNTLRFLSYRECGVPVAMWIGLAAFAGVAGPFGTLDALPLLPRLAYWTGVVAVSIPLGCLTSRTATKLKPAQQAGVWAVFLVGMSAIVHLANSIIFPAWQGWSDYLYLVGIVCLVTAMVHLFVWVFSMTSPGTEASSVIADAVFQERLPDELRGPIIRIEAKDHHLQVVTDRGAGLILMRLADALSLLKGSSGLQVHRSHWVALQGVAGHLQEAGRDWLICSDGSRVPVSRRYRLAAIKAGLM